MRANCDSASGGIAYRQTRSVPPYSKWPAARVPAARAYLAVRRGGPATFTTGPAPTRTRHLSTASSRPAPPRARDRLSWLRRARYQWKAVVRSDRTEGSRCAKTERPTHLSAPSHMGCSFAQPSEATPTGASAWDRGARRLRRPHRAVELDGDAAAERKDQRTSQGPPSVLLNRRKVVCVDELELVEASETTSRLLGRHHICSATKEP
jgi:hypothetical protein